MTPADRSNAMLRALLLGACGCVAPAFAAPADPVPDPAAPPPPVSALPAPAPAARTGAAAGLQDGLYPEFRRLYDAREYAAALPYALRIVQLVEADPGLAQQVPTALNNLGATQLEVGDHAGAAASFQRALELLEATEGVGSRRMISPLFGLGRAQAAQGQHGHAIEALNRALSISRRADGLFNLTQLDIMDVLATSLMAVEDYDASESLRTYALQIVEHRYGVDDPRTLAQVNRLGAWYELTGRYPLARMMYLRSLRIANATANGRNMVAINALRGVARTHRLQFALDPESLINGPQTPSLDSGRSDQMFPNPMLFDQPALGQPAARLNNEGEQALLRALKTLDESAGVPKELRGILEVELGDWYMTARRPDLALVHYRLAWPLLPSSALDRNQNPLLAPRQLLYRRPASAQRNRDLPRDEVNRKVVEYAFTVTPRGEVKDIQTLSSEITRSQENSVRNALEEAVYSPRFENGEAAETTDVRFRETYYEEIEKKKDDKDGGTEAVNAGGVLSQDVEPAAPAADAPATPAPAPTTEAAPATPTPTPAPAPETAPATETATP